MRYTLAEIDAFGRAAARRKKRERLQRLADMRAVRHDETNFSKYYKALSK